MTYVISAPRIDVPDRAILSEGDLPGTPGPNLAPDDAVVESSQPSC